jgi:hypothetical protein
LIQDKDMELMPLELNHMLEEELAKPEAEIDVALVDELLKLLEESEPSEVEKRRIWHGITDQLEKDSRKRTSRTVLHRVAAILIGVIALATLTVGTAQAFRLTFLLKLLEPLAQTFGIVTTDQLSELSQIDKNIRIENDVTEQNVFTSLDAMPVEVNGHKIIPAWVPERYSFEHGTTFDNESFQRYTVTYQSNDDWLFIETTLFRAEDASVDFQYERSAYEPIMIDVAGVGVQLYTNDENKTIYASWLNDTVSYNLSGALTEHELVRIVGSIVE